MGEDKDERKGNNFNFSVSGVHSLTINTGTARLFVSYQSI